MATPFRKMEDDDIDELYSHASNAVSTWKTVANPNIRLAGFDKCIHGEQALTCKMLGIQVGMIRDMYSKLEQHLPGADIYIETQPDKSVNYNLNLPIHSKATHKSRASRHSGGNVSVDSTKPSTEWGMFLLMLDVTMCAVLWFRVSTGIAV